MRADQTTVDIRLCKQLLAVRRLHRSAILDTDLLSRIGVIDLCDGITDCLADLLSLVSRCRLAGSDCPDRLVCDDHGSRLLLCHSLEIRLDLKADPVEGHTCFSLLKRLAAAEDRCQAMLKRLQNLLVQELICLIEVLTSLGVSDDDPLAACIDKHVRGNLTSEGSLLLDIHILSANRDICSLHSLDDRDNINCRYAVNNIGISPGNKRLQVSTRAFASVGVMFIFQLPAIIFFLAMAL